VKNGFHPRISKIPQHARHSPAAFWASGWPCRFVFSSKALQPLSLFSSNPFFGAALFLGGFFASFHFEHISKTSPSVRLLFGRASRGGLGAGVGICQTLSQVQRSTLAKARQNRAGGVFGVRLGLGSHGA
jgi:hypothetical protein